MSRWAAAAPLASAAAIAALRRVTGVDVLATPDTVWLCGRRDEEVEKLVRAIPGARRFTYDDDDLLVPEGARLAVSRLPEGDWKPLIEWLELALPKPAKAGTPAETLCITLLLVRESVGVPPLGGSGNRVKAELQTEPHALLTSLANWAAYAETAPRMRLEPLRFAACADGRVLILGEPLPPLPGVRFWEREGLLIECGWHWSPRVEPALVRAALQLEKDDLLLWSTSAGCQQFSQHDLTAARRAAIRATAQAVTHGR